MKARIEIRIWNDDKIEPAIDELVEVFQPYAEHVADMLAQGYQSGEIVQSGFRGWWEIIVG